MLLTSLASRDTFLAMFFLLMTPFFADTAITDFALFRTSIAFSAFSAVAARTDLMAFFILVLIIMLRMRLVSLWMARFFADLWFANDPTPYLYVLNGYVFLKILSAFAPA
jgi:hypothetical protein